MDLAKIRKKAKSRKAAPGKQKAPEKPRPAKDEPQQDALSKVVDDLVKDVRPDEGSADAAPAAEPPPAETAAPPSPADPPPGPPPRPEPPAGDPPPANAPEPEAPAVEEGAPDPPLSDEEPGRDEKMTIFSVGNERYAVPVRDINMIIENRPPTRIPNVPEFLVGVIAMRGRLVTVIDVRRRLGFTGASNLEESKIIVVQQGNDTFGLRVEAIEQVVDINRSTFEVPPEGFSQSGQDFVNGVFYHEKRVVASLNLDQLLTFEVLNHDRPVSKLSQALPDEG